jgi:acetyl-CoA synthetase
VTGDLGRRDQDGYFWFEGRAGDMIKSAGYRIGPFEVESALLKHPAVAEGAVVGKPDEMRGEIGKAFIVLRPGITGNDELARELALAVKGAVGRHQYPAPSSFWMSCRKPKPARFNGSLCASGREGRGDADLSTGRSERCVA